MRITIVIEHFVPASGGAEGMAVAVVRGLMRRGHDVQVVARTGKPLDECLLHIVNDGDYARTAGAVAGGGLVMDWGLLVPADLHRLGGGLTRAFLDYNALPFHPTIRWLKRLLDRSSFKHRRSIRRQMVLLQRPQARFIAVSEFVAKQVREQ
ncbi:MAG TPA: hypothetical protein VLU94_03260, partial [Candidatus Nitrosotalea sp.]|nr:hypothetical protein [Candidatus Nitrosotalea sp.]